MKEEVGSPDCYQCYPISMRVSDLGWTMEKQKQKEPVSPHWAAGPTDPEACSTTGISTLKSYISTLLKAVGFSVVCSWSHSGWCMWASDLVWSGLWLSDLHNWLGSALLCGSALFPDSSCTGQGSPQKQNQWELYLPILTCISIYLFINQENLF